MFNWVEDGADPLENVTIDKEQRKGEINFVQDLDFDSKINRFTLIKDIFDNFLSLLHIPDT